VGYRF